MLSKICKGEKNVYWKTICLKQRFTQGIHLLKVRVMFDSLQPHGLYSPWSSLGQNTGVGSLSFL